MLVRSAPVRREQEAGVRHAAPGRDRESLALGLLAALGILVAVAVSLADFSPGDRADLRVGLATGAAEDLGEVDWVSHLDARLMRHVFDERPDSWDEAFYRRTAARGITVIPVIDVQPVPSTARAREAFAELVLAHVRRFGPRGSFWEENPLLPRALAPRVFEVMNEPYIDRVGGPYDPEAYARVVKRVAELVRPADPEVRVGIALATTFFSNDADSGKPWLPALYRAVPDLNDHFDVASVHPYAGDPDTCDPSERFCFRQVEVIRSMLDARGASDKRVYISEIGNNTGGQSAVSEREQAAYLRRYVELARDYGWVEALVYYNYRDLCDDPANKECWFGVLREDGSPKPAFEALKQAASANP